MSSEFSNEQQTIISDFSGTQHNNIEWLNDATRVREGGWGVVGVGGGGRGLEREIYGCFFVCVSRLVVATVFQTINGKPYVFRLKEQHNHVCNFRKIRSSPYLTLSFSG